MKKLLTTVIFGTLLSACSSIPIEPQARGIIVSPKTAPAGCKYLGQVVGSQGNFFSGGYTSNRNLEEGAMNDLKNKASRLGANYIQLLVNRAGVTGAQHGGAGAGTGYMSGRSEQTNVTNLGNAYFCSPKAIGLE